MAAGFPGVLVLLALGLLIALAFAAVGAFIGLQHRLGRGGAGLLPARLRRCSSFSSMSLPRDLIAQDWFRTVAT